MAVKNYGIHDKWTDLDKLNNVDIKSVDGVIESVKINGEEAGGGGGSSDFSTAKLTYNNTAGGGGSLILCTARDYSEISSSAPTIDENGTYDVILYKGLAYGTLFDTSVNVTCSGNAEYDDGDLYITGDCTITIS